MENMFNEKKDPINYKLYQNFISNLDFEQMRSDLTESIYTDVISRIRKDLPEIFEDIQKTLKSLKGNMQEFEKTRQFVIEKTSKCVDSNNLYADVYKMRDILTELSLDMQRFKKSIQNIFPIDSENEDQDD